ncbi:unnamed protein product [Heterobilharzia americana]|nr:unnamed protein product [Heterobilharzia americana]
MQNSSSVLHLILVGFHHRKGSVELIYPPIANETFQEKSQLPHSWRHLPSLAIADGAHNYAKDCTYFTLPSSEKKDETVFGVACYRQANSASYVQPNPEITRNTVQKSLVVLSRFPLFGFIAHHLAKITDFLLKKKGFTQESLRNSYEELSIIVESVLNNPMSYQDALFYNLNAANFAYSVYRDSGGIVSNWILTLLSLYPDMLRGGLLQCSVVDSSWTSECLCCSNTNNSDTTNLTFAASMNDGSPFNITEQFSRSVQETTVQDEQQNRNLPSVKNEHAWFTDVQHTSYVNPSSAGDSLSQKDSTTSMTGLNQSFSLYSPFPTDDWGFPLSLFTKSYLAPIYIPLVYWIPFWNLPALYHHSIQV